MYVHKGVGRMEPIYICLFPHRPYSPFPLPPGILSNTETERQRDRDREKERKRKRAIRFYFLEPPTTIELESGGGGVKYVLIFQRRYMKHP